MALRTVIMNWALCPAGEANNTDKTSSLSSPDSGPHHPTNFDSIQTQCEALELPRISHSVSGPASISLAKFVLSPCFHERRSNARRLEIAEPTDGERLKVLLLRDCLKLSGVLFVAPTDRSTSATKWPFARIKKENSSCTFANQTDAKLLSIFFLPFYYSHHHHHHARVIFLFCWSRYDASL